MTSGPNSRAVATGSETLASLLERLGEPRALADGRAFVNGRRARPSDGAVAPGAGAVVEVYAPRSVDGDVVILRVDHGLAFVNKPPGIATEPEKRGSVTSLVHLAAAALGLAPTAVHALSRLDVGVSGVVILGLEPAAERRVRTERESGHVRRRYVALAAGVPEPATGAWNEPIGKGSRGPLRAVRPDGERASTGYRLVGTAERGTTRASLLAFDPATGRTHQLRVHAAFHGAPLFGDKSYGGPARAVSATGAVTPLTRIYLHAAWVALPDVGTVEAPLPAEFNELWTALGGDASELAKACATEELDPSLGPNGPGAETTT